MCPICLCQDESVEHLFLLCSWVAAIWFGGALNYRIDNFVVPDRQFLVPRWMPPTSHFFKINVDASWSRGSKSGFVGVVMRAEGGSFVAAARYAILSPSVDAAEACALLRGCELGSALGCSSVILESDSRESISSFQFCRWSWVPRSANSSADFLASVGCPEMCDRVWVDRPPSSLVHVLNKDGLPCPP
ncbi:unnamed protein product [Malus baccata var. baccata]